MASAVMLFVRQNYSAWPLVAGEVELFPRGKRGRSVTRRVASLLVSARARASRALLPVARCFRAARVGCRQHCVNSRSARLRLCRGVREHSAKPGIMVGWKLGLLLFVWGDPGRAAVLFEFGGRAPRRRGAARCWPPRCF